MSTHKSKDVPVMHSQVYRSHYSHVCYVISMANTTVVKSLNLGGESLAFPAITRRLWQPRAMQLSIGQITECAIRNQWIFKFSTFSTPSIFALGLSLLIQNVLCCGSRQLRCRQILNSGARDNRCCKYCKRKTIGSKCIAEGSEFYGSELLIYMKFNI